MSIILRPEVAGRTGVSRFASCANIMNSEKFAVLVERFVKENKEVGNMEMPLVAFPCGGQGAPSNLVMAFF